MLLALFLHLVACRPEAKGAYTVQEEVGAAS